MVELDKKYQDQLDEIKTKVQESPVLAQYLDEEEDAYYKELQQTFEPEIHALYSEVADHNPIQLEVFEKACLDSALEGLYLPKILGYAVMRGEVNDNIKYRKPQDHFREVLLAICGSANFELIKQRIGQTIKLGFALSSDIWITNIFDVLSNKRVKTYLQSMRGSEYRELSNRKALYNKYKAQLSNFNYQSTEFPKSAIELKSSFHSIKSFLLYRSTHDYDNASLMGYVKELINNDNLVEAEGYLELMIIGGLFYRIDDDTTSKFKATIKKIASSTEDFETRFFEILYKLYADPKISVYPDAEKRLGSLVADEVGGEIKRYFEVADVVHTKGFVHLDAMDTVRAYVDSNKGTSVQNKCIRMCLLGYFRKYIDNLEATDYPDFIETNKIITVYLDIFGNEKFNQAVKESSITLVRKCIKAFPDKRGRDYQDVKKYVKTAFVDMGYLTAKEVVELFKTKRKKKVES